MHVDAFIETFAGEDTLSLLRCMAVAGGNASLDDTTISELEAKRLIISYKRPDTEPFRQWPGLIDKTPLDFHVVKGCSIGNRIDATTIRQYRQVFDIKHENPDGGFVITQSQFLR